MLLTESLNISTDVIFSPRKKEKILEMLKDRYEGICYKGVFVRRVLGIKTLSSPICQICSLGGGSIVAVTFEADTVQYNKGDLITDAKLNAIIANNTTAENEVAIIQISKDADNRIHESIRQGQILPMVVEQVAYPYGRNKIVINARPWLPLWNPTAVYEVSEDTGTVNMEFKWPPDGPQMVFAEGITYPGLDPSKRSPMTSWDKIELSDIPKYKYITWVDEYPRAVFGRNTPYTGDNLYRGDSLSVSKVVCGFIKSHHTLITEILKLTPTKEDMQADILYWKLCKSVKSDRELQL